MRTLLLALTLLLLPATAAATAAADGSLRIVDHGKVRQTLSRAEVLRLGTVTVRAFDPYESREITFTAVPLAKVLDRAFGPAWRKAEELVLPCLDGYQPSLPARRFAEHRAYLAISRADRREFTLDMPAGRGKTRTVQLAPYYVIWDSLGDGVIRGEGHLGWAFALGGLELVDFRTRFGALAPPAGKDQGGLVGRGFAAFRVHCLPCHAINGQGGQVGPELNYPANVTEYFAGAWLRRWITDPQTVRWNARMPPLGLPDGLRERTLDELLAYLEAMRARKIAPP